MRSCAIALALLLALCGAAQAQTLTPVPIDQLGAAGAATGADILSVEVGPTPSLPQLKQTFSALRTFVYSGRAANSTIGNSTNAVAGASDMPVPTCNGGASAIQYTGGTGWGCAVITPGGWQVQSAGWIAGGNPNGAIVMSIPQAATLRYASITVSTVVGGTAGVTVRQAASSSDCRLGAAMTSAGNANANANQVIALTLLSTPMNAGSQLCLQSADTSWATGTGIGTITIAFTVP